MNSNDNQLKESNANGELPKGMFAMRHVISIETKYFGPTNTRGSKVKASCHRFDQSKAIGWDYALNPFENHSQVARLLAHNIDAAGELMSFSETKTGYSFHFKFASDKE